MNKKNKWQKIWEKKGKLKDRNITLRKLISMNGFDSGAGKIGVENWKKYIEVVINELGIQKGDSIYEVGCGSGGFLYQFYKRGNGVGGVDYSRSLIKIAKKIIRGDFNVGEARKLNTKRKYDFVVANSVFQYFPDFDYALMVVSKMLDKANKGIGIFDVPNEHLKEKSERARRGSLKKGEYKRKYERLSHLYYDKIGFINWGKEHNYKVRIFNQNIKNYGNNHFRFNIVITK
jgi:ubiquinone/menaquinone biosynthesis C-methylase UbiE